MAEHPIPLDPVGTQDLPLRLLVAARDAAGMPLGGVHLGPPRFQVHLRVRLSLGAVNRPASPSFAVRCHRSSNPSKLAFVLAYHLTTG